MHKKFTKRSVLQLTDFTAQSKKGPHAQGVNMHGFVWEFVCAIYKFSFTHSKCSFVLPQEAANMPLVSMIKKAKTTPLFNSVNANAGTEQAEK